MLKTRMHSTQSADCVDPFFAVWRRAVARAGTRFFGDGTEATLMRAEDKWDLEPRGQAIREALDTLSRGDAAFLAALYSFYNASNAALVWRALGLHGFSDLCVRLDPDAKRIVADLMLLYRGW